MNFYEKFPSATREVHIDLNLYRPEPNTPVSDWIEFDTGFSVVSLSKAKKATAYDLFTPADGLTLCIPKKGDKVFVRKS